MNFLPAIFPKPWVCYEQAMFFSLSKIIGPLLAPLNLMFLLFMAGLVLRCIKKPAGYLFIGLGMGILLLCGVMPLGHNLLVDLESRYEMPAVMPDKIDGIIVFGGGMSTEIGQGRGVAALNDGGERVIIGLALAQDYPEAQLVFSGGNNRLRGGEPEAASVRRLLDVLNFPLQRVVFEDSSRNSAENVIKTRALVQPDENSTWVFVTSAWHMPRIAALIHSAAWPGEVILYPTDYRTDGKKRLFPSRLDIRRNMDKASLALHEAWGWLVYRVTGKIDPSGV